MPHPIHTVEKGRPFYCVWIKMWGDNVSGNCSKHWNKHWNWYLAHAGLPRRLLHQEYFVCFVSTSPHASVLEQASRICEQIRYAMRHTSQITLISLSPRSTEQALWHLIVNRKRKLCSQLGFSVYQQTILCSLSWHHILDSKVIFSVTDVQLVGPSNKKAQRRDFMPYCQF